ncbi:MAG: thiamine phosphate synthase [Devosiaceae bacterium]|nr:thiamine phosphate synthase [Devosiaceae bacterium]
MDQQIFIIIPANGKIKQLLQNITELLKHVPVAALLLSKGHEQTEYEQIAKQILPITKAHDCALLLDNEPNLTKSIGADGVHIDGDIKTIKAALEELKPDLIVGAGNVTSKHEAMEKGELGVDYVFFSETNAEEGNSFDLANWWVETFEVPAIYNIKNKDLSNNPQTEFLAFNFTDFSSAKEMIEFLSR